MQSTVIIPWIPVLSVDKTKTDSLNRIYRNCWSDSQGQSMKRDVSRLFKKMFTIFSDQNNPKYETSHFLYKYKNQITFLTLRLRNFIHCSLLQPSPSDKSMLLCIGSFTRSVAAWCEHSLRTWIVSHWWICLKHSWF